MVDAGMSSETLPLWGYGKSFTVFFVVITLLNTTWKNSQGRRWLERHKSLRWVYGFILGQILMSLLLTGVIVYLVPNFVPKTSNDLPTLAIAVFLFGASLFMILDEAMYRGVGRWLTKRLGGNNWVKQIDYIYLLMGSAGIVVSLNRLSMVTGKIEFLNDIGPLVLAAAIAIRLTKTRIEVNGWDKIGGKAPQDSKAGAEAAD
jgi:membrane protease YdiL (CAAX protease family)